MPVVGAPAHALEATERFGAKGAVGARGELLSAQVLDKELGQDPTTWVFHHCRAPGQSHADVDHVVVRGTASGTRVCLVDSKCWSPGSYWRLGPTVRRGFSRVDAASKIRLAATVDEVRKGLPGIAVFGLGVIWPSHPGSISLGVGPFRTAFPGGIRVCLGDSLAELVDALLGSGTTEPLAQVLSYWNSRRPR